MVVPSDSDVKDGDESCFKQSWDEGNFNLKICNDSNKQELVFYVDLPDDSWLGIGFGPTMKNTDMLVW